MHPKEKLLRFLYKAYQNSILAKGPHNMYRIVINEFNNTAIVTPQAKGYEGVITLDASKILEYPNKEQLTSAENKFLEQAKKFGWVKGTKFNGIVRKINQQFHLRKLQIELTTKCNLKCAYCYSESGPHAHSKLSLPTALEIIDNADEMGVTHIDLTGGEFFLFPQWEELLKALYSRNFAVTIHTNGTALTEDNLERLKQYQIRSIQVSLDSHRAEIHDKVRGLPGAWKKLVRGVKLALSAGIKVNIVYMVHKENYTELDLAKNWIRQEFGQKVKIMFDRIIPTGAELTNSVGLSAAEYYAAVAPVVKSGNSQLTKICDSGISNPAKKIEPHCGVAHNLVYITADGEIALCPTMTSRDARIFTGPNIAEFSLKEAWVNHPVFIKYRGANCKNITICPANKSCGGGCRSNAYFDTGDVYSPDEVSCNFQKNDSATYVRYLNEYARKSLYPIKQIG